jgi:tetratricopeptide (TPR) repeat protein
MRILLMLVVLFMAAWVAPLSHAEEEKKTAPSQMIDAATGKILTEAIEALNVENYDGVRQAIAKLKLDNLSPYELSQVEQILASIDQSQENYPSARNHLEKAIAAGGLNDVDILRLHYQIAQLWLAEEKWKEGAAALEEWFRMTTTPNSAAYYLLAIAYYQQDQLDRALAPAQKAVELSDAPQESWLSLLLALHLQKEHWKEAVPLLTRLIDMFPDKKSYWLQLSSVYGQLEQYSKALAVMQLAYNAGLIVDDGDVRRLADLMLFNDLPYRCGQLLDQAVTRKTVKIDSKLYEKQANCWIAAREYDKSIDPLGKAAELADNGELFVRLGEVEVQRSEWANASAALTKGINKGGLKDVGNAQLMLGIALYNQKQMAQAKSWFEKARSSAKQKRTAEGYLQIIRAQES